MEELGAALIAAGAALLGAIVGGWGATKAARVAAEEARTDDRAKARAELYVDMYVWVLRCRNWAVRTAAGYRVEYPHDRWGEWSEQLLARVAISPDLPPSLESTYERFLLAVLELREQTVDLDLVPVPDVGLGAATVNEGDFPAAVAVLHLTDELRQALRKELAAAGTPT